MLKSIHPLTTTPTNHTHRFQPLQLATPASCSPHPLVTPIHSTHSPQLSSILLVQSMDDNCGEWVECTCMSVASVCGEQEAGEASGSVWNLWLWLVGVVVMRYRFHHTTYPLLLLYLFFFAAAIHFLFIFKMFFVLYILRWVIMCIVKPLPYLWEQSVRLSWQTYSCFIKSIRT